METVISLLLEDRDYSLWVILRQVGDLVLRARDKELSKYGISAVQASVLFVLDANGGKATPTEISKWLLRKHHSVLSLLDRMEKEGLVSRVRDPENSRRANYEVTEKGQQVFSESARIESIREVMSCLGERERRQLWSTLRKLRDIALRSATTSEVPFP